MKQILPSEYKILPEISSAINRNSGVVALESAVITHGLPYPVNFKLGQEMEEIIQEADLTPATIALINGKISIGLTREELAALSNNPDQIKVSSRMMGIGIARNLSGGTTVAATLVASHIAGIKVFCTGGIGGVHRGNSNDVSADLDELARRPVVVVCAGAKAILDLPATLEALETRGVPVIGYQTEDFPAFYTRSSNLKLDARVDSPEEIAQIANAHWQSGNNSAILVCNPLPEEYALDEKRINQSIEKAVAKAEKKGIKGSALSPFLLEQMRELTEGESMLANLELLKNNARLVTKIAACLAKPRKLLS